MRKIIVDFCREGSPADPGDSQIFLIFFRFLEKKHVEIELDFQSNKTKIM